MAHPDTLYPRSWCAMHRCKPWPCSTTVQRPGSFPHMIALIHSLAHSHLGACDLVWARQARPAVPPAAAWSSNACCLQDSTWRQLRLSTLSCGRMMPPLAAWVATISEGQAEDSQHEMHRVCALQPASAKSRSESGARAPCTVHRAGMSLEYSCFTALYLWMGVLRGCGSTSRHADGDPGHVCTPAMADFDSCPCKPPLLRYELVKGFKSLGADTFGSGNDQKGVVD